MNFSINTLDKNVITLMKSSNCWNEKSPLELSELVMLELTYIKFDQKVCDDGVLISSERLAKRVLNIFKSLFEIRFPIANITPAYHFKHASDELSMQHNSTSCFNARTIAGTNRLSLHAYGAAIDINPIQNPYLRINTDSSSIVVSPKAGIYHVNRNYEYIGKVNSEVINIFKQNDFSVWGGSWKNRYDAIDYQHFQVSDELRKQIVG